MAKATARTTALYGMSKLMGGLFSSRRDPSVQFNYMIEIDSISMGMFTEASGIKWSMRVDEIKEGGVNNHQQHLLGRASYEPLVLKRGFVGKESFLFDMMNTTFDPNMPIIRSIVHVVVLQRGGASGLMGGEIGRLSFYNCFVQEWSGPSFNTKQNEMALESITFRYDFMQFHPGSPLEQLLHSAAMGAASTAMGAMANAGASV